MPDFLYMEFSRSSADLFLSKSLHLIGFIILILMRKKYFLAFAEEPRNNSFQW